ncbi:hypothetical protein B0H16DRAFT_828307 [Mycena metata]|uniref:Uncharacterized protein n=1 Tax=Mycena metata TaxID=1033252 RepID=A0AAD7DR14_9AGAR|nr:hypothetical protein B0H16DRAFT_828307 [Mycena metata]
MCGARSVSFCSFFAYVNKSLKDKWASEMASLVVQHAFENLEESAKDGIVDELLGQCSAVFGGSCCVQHSVSPFFPFSSLFSADYSCTVLEHRSDKYHQILLAGLVEYATNEQGSKGVVKALKEGGKETLDRAVQRMCEPADGCILLFFPALISCTNWGCRARHAMIVDLVLSLTSSQLIASVLPTADKDQRALQYECIRGHIVTLRGCKSRWKDLPWCCPYLVVLTYFYCNGRTGVPVATLTIEVLSWGAGCT